MAKPIGRIKRKNLHYTHVYSVVDDDTGKEVVRVRSKKKMVIRKAVSDSLRKL